ncbi:MAG: DUF4990 domain-containing protein [Opitutaceae bacterium]|nr:DUF4990 domain-containing protein [Opitutaceae bacterium]
MIVSALSRCSRHPILIAGLLALLATSGSAATSYVAPDGSDASPGTQAAPFATIQRAQAAVEPGDTVYLRGGKYDMTEAHITRRQGPYAYVTHLDKSGAAGKPITYSAYPGERPVFDFAAVKPAGMRVTAFRIDGSWLRLKGIEVVGVQVTITRHTQSICFDNQGSNNVYEQLSMHDGMAIGLWIGNGSNNLVLNCDAYRNHDNVSENKKGGNVDGFGYHGPKGSVNNVFRGCRAWFNSDDGFDFINSAEVATAENCWAFYNGYSPDFESLADGNGFKAGGHAGTPVARLPNPIPRHVVRRSVAVRNKANGFYANHHIGGVEFIHNTAHRNRVNFNLLGREADNRTDIPGVQHRLKNNLGFAGNTEVGQMNADACDVSGNYFNLSVTISVEDFLSVDEAELMKPRQPNGDLPNVPFLRLAPGSDAIDKGIKLGDEFRGAAPDLGAFEFGP